ncbi:hypothetical protein BJP27_24515 (plasmid) [Pseudomonas oryzihabitans]|nr:hypothetical protein BJP27_23865 [Pseudomonas psychrotolerans]APQ14736.1 hypothetical protein BJP27_24515 [Pseudomonas psychrotolerans]
MTATRARKKERDFVTFPSPTADEVFRGRTIVGITQEQAATVAGVSRRIWIKYESGEVKMTGRAWINWCFRFDLVKPDL